MSKVEVSRAQTPELPSKNIVKQASQDTLNMPAAYQPGLVEDITFKQYFEMGPMYVVDIIYSIDFEPIQNVDVTSATWGYAKPEWMVLIPVGAKSDFKAFLKLFQQQLFQYLQDPIDATKSRQVLRQFVMVIGYLVKSNFSGLSNIIIYKTYMLISQLIVNYKEVYDDSDFVARLRELQIIFEQPVEHNLKPIDTIKPDSAHCLGMLNIAIPFTKISMTDSQIGLLKNVFQKFGTIAQSIPSEITSEIRLSYNYLLQLNEGEREQSPRWFRENGSIPKRKTLLQIGFLAFPKEELDPILVANYIKKLVRSIQPGLIPDCLQSLLISLIGYKTGCSIINAELDRNTIDCAYALLSISDERLTIIIQLAELCQIVLSHGTLKFAPSDLARVLKITEDPKGDFIADVVLESLNEWNEVWGKILSNPNMFLFPVSS